MEVLTSPWREGSRDITRGGICHCVLHKDNIMFSMCRHDYCLEIRRNIRDSEAISASLNRPI